MPIANLTSLRSRLTRANAQWTAQQTNLSNLTDAQKRARLGVIVDQAEVAAAMAPLTLGAAVANFAPEVDWRNRNGNHVSHIEDQGYCGSCVSFCCCGLVSSMASIEQGQLLDLSEADLHFCSSHGATCGGWWPSDALNTIKARGVVDEAHYPYMTAFASPPQIDPNPPKLWLPHCNSVADRDAHAVKITQSGTIADIVERKNYLTNVGPCAGILHVFNDFYSYSAGIYHHVTGADMGLHCVEVIGYSEAEQCWICKNSWGAGWGMGGFFKIGYGQAGLDTEFPFWTAGGVQIPPAHRWYGWENLGGILDSAPAVASWAANRLDSFVCGTDNQMWHLWWDGKSWNGWENLGGTLASAPAAVSWGPNRIDCFIRGTDNHMWHKWWDGTRWNGWEDLGGVITSAPAVASWSANRLDCFAKGTDNHMWHLWWDGKSWNGWEDLGGVIDSAPAAVSWGPNRIDCFTRGIDNHMWHKWWA
jgi:C1A family cysteine protease